MSRTLRTNTIDETYDKTQRHQKSIREHRYGLHTTIEPYAPSYR